MSGENIDIGIVDGSEMYDIFMPLFTKEKTRGGVPVYKEDEYKSLRYFLDDLNYSIYNYSDVLYAYVIKDGALIAVSKVMKTSSGQWAIAYTEVREDYRNQGYASKLMESLFDFAHKHNMDLVSTAYTKLGYIKLKPLTEKLAKKYNVNYIEKDEKHGWHELDKEAWNTNIENDYKEYLKSINESIHSFLDSLHELDPVLIESISTAWHLIDDVGIFESVSSYSSRTKHIEDYDIYIPIGSVSGTLYHGTSFEDDDDDDDEIFDTFNPNVYGDYDAIWVTDDKYIAEEFSNRNGHNNRYVIEVEYSSTNMAIIDQGLFNDLKEYLGIYDLREAIPFLKNEGFDGWITQGSIGRHVYNDIAIFNYDDIKIISNEPIMESTKTSEFIKYAHPYVSPRARKLTPEEKNVRDISYAIKKPGSPQIKQAAIDMAKHVNSGHILIPIPSSKGDTSANLELSQAISKLTGAKVIDILGMKSPRESTKILETTGKSRLKAEEMGFILKEPMDSIYNVLFVDNVAASGATIQAARNLVNGGEGLVYSKTEFNSITMNESSELPRN